MQRRGTLSSAIWISWSYMSHRTVGTVAICKGCQVSAELPDKCHRDSASPQAWQALPWWSTKPTKREVIMSRGQCDHRESHSPSTRFATWSTTGGPHQQEPLSVRRRNLADLGPRCTERSTLMHSFLETAAIQNDSNYFGHSSILSYLSLLLN